MTGVIERLKQSLQGSLIDWGEEPGDGQLDRLLHSMGAHSHPHAHGRPLCDHLTGTRNILRAWSQPFWIQAAGLFHSVYSTDVYRRQVLDAGRREELKAALGKRAERLVFLFGRVPRQALFDRLGKAPSPLARGLSVPVEAPGERSEVTLTPAEVFGLVVIHMANEAEQSRLADGQPGLWLARVSALGALARKAEGTPPPVFDACAALFSPDDEMLLRETYARAFVAGASGGALADDYFAECSRLCPWVAEPLILRAFVRLREGDAAGARELGLQAAKLLDQWGTAWDKRLSWAEWRRLAALLGDGAQLGRVGRILPDCIDAPRALFNRVVGDPEVRSFSLPAPAAQPANEVGARLALTRLEHYIGSFADETADPRRARYPGLPSQPWFDGKEFPIVSALEGAYEQIRDEIRRLADEDFHPESEKITRTGAWDVFFFYERGRKNADNCARCPTITSIIEQHETVRTQAGLIYVSRMRPGTHVTPHRGPTNLRVRCHLGVQVPEGDCGLLVGGERGGWRQGRCVVFDDYYEHEAWNRTDEDRIVLIVDLWHPGLTQHEREVLKGLHRYAAAHAESLRQYWEGNEKAKAAQAYY